ncbi:hypothetical protein BJ138DRAFT_1081399 [Hygrophoropsis aurantiaca]|uniref:Uncharacterized protein n=1 Tax=Hygrophoropsis aurantiaca TaxID=72124 RepID=A0ACB8AK12_9AGAM|nr:hypothetical protein BJ138DRAFT_1081399 [Hygrophoropsis aurantiaca]
MSLFSRYSNNSSARQRNYPQTSLYHRPGGISNAFIACLSILVFVTVANVICTFYTLALLKQLTPPIHDYTYEGDDFPSQLPVEIPLVGLSLESGEDHFSLYDDDEWGTLFPSDGFVSLGPNNRTFLLSAYHQFHCLDIIRVGYVVNGTHAAEHIQHCLRYLRQTILCHSDTTLEVDIPQRSPMDGKLVHTGNGVGSIHRCRDWTMLRQYMLDHPSLPFDPTD